MIRRTLVGLLLAPLLAGCASLSPAPSAEIRRTLAPTGSLRVALYTGSPTSVIGQDDLRGVGYDLGRVLAHQLRVPFQPMVMAKNAEVQEAIKTGAADVAFTNPSAARAKDVDFTQPYLVIELGYLAGPHSPVATMADVDRAGVRVGVTAASSSQAVLSRDLKNARVVPSATLAEGSRMLAAGEIDVYATNKAVLAVLASALPGARILDGKWGDEPNALAMPKGRAAGLPYLREFIDRSITSGAVRAAITRANMRGAAVARIGPPSAP